VDTNDWMDDDVRLEEMRNVVRILIEGAHFGLSTGDFGGTAYMIMSQLAVKHDFIWLDYEQGENTEPWEWITNPDGNHSSEHYLLCSGKIRGILRKELFHLPRNTACISSATTAILTVLQKLNVVPSE
jgi:hypothetical protein